MSNNPFGPSDPPGYEEDDARSFFDQLSAQVPPLDSAPAHMSEALPVEVMASPQPDLTSQETSAHEYNAQISPQITQKLTNASGEVIIGNRVTGLETGLGDQGTGLLNPGYEQPPITDSAIAETQNFPPAQDAGRPAHPNLVATQFNIPLTPQYDSTARESVFAAHLATPEQLGGTTSLESTVPTQLTPVQSAMMMSMTTSLLVTNPSPQSCIDIEATTAKFQQASLGSEASNVSGNTSGFSENVNILGGGVNNPGGGASNPAGGANNPGVGADNLGGNSNDLGQQTAANEDGSAAQGAVSASSVPSQTTPNPVSKATATTEAVPPVSLVTIKKGTPPPASVPKESAQDGFNKMKQFEMPGRGGLVGESKAKQGETEAHKAKQTDTEAFNRAKQNESNLFKYFGSTKKGNPFDNLGGPMPGGGNESAMINPVYMSPTESFNISNAIPSPDSFLTPATEQDVFTASLLSSDADRRHDSWIPSEATKQALVSMATSPPGTYFPERELLTMPGIAVKEDFGDPVKNLVRTYLGEEQAAKRVVLTASSVTQDDRGLRQLISAGCYHAAVNLTTQLLTVYGQGEGRAGHPSKHTAHSIQLWFTRIALLIKLRRFSLAEVECQYFGDLDAPDLYFEFYPELYGGRKGSMVPFGFRLLVAELPQHLGKHTQALDRLSALLRTCNQIIQNLGMGLSEDGSNLEMTTNMRDDSLKLWRTRKQRVLYSITNCAVNLKDFRLAGSLLERLIQEDPNSAAGLYSALGRLCLQLGDVTAAQETFNHHLEHSPPPPHHDPVQGLLHSAYVSIAQNAFKDAAEILQQAHKLNPNNGLVMNNLGVCLMYTGQVTESIKLMESAIFSQPDRFLHEALVLNLATMYELESSNAHQKKLKLLALISQHKGDSFNVAALKLQPQ